MMATKLSNLLMESIYLISHKTMTLSDISLSIYSYDWQTLKINPFLTHKLLY